MRHGMKSRKRRQDTWSRPIIPAWMPGDMVEVIETGFVGHCLYPVPGTQYRSWMVELARGRIVSAPATGLRAYAPG